MLKLFANLSAARNKPVETEDAATEAVEAMRLDLAARSSEVTTLTTKLSDVSASNTKLLSALGASTVDDAITSITALRAAQEREKKAGEKAVDLEVEALLKENENKLTVPMKEHFAASMKAEIMSGKAAKDTATYKALASMPAMTELSRRTAGADDGKNMPNDSETKISIRAKELREKDPKLSVRESYRLASEELPAAERLGRTHAPALVAE